MSLPLVIGIDIGTSGARAVAIDASCNVIAQAAASFGETVSIVRDPRLWWEAVSDALSALLKSIDPNSVCAIAVDGTSGTVLPVDASGQPLADPLMYSDTVDDRSLVERIDQIAPAESAAHGASSGLAKALTFVGLPKLYKTVHQADWVSGHLSGRYDLTDENNALKTGYDPVARNWPDWIADAGMPIALLPETKEPGAPLAPISPDASRRFGLPRDVLIVAGTTDGCASFLATGAGEPGDGVTSLGSTLTLKLLSSKPVFAPQYGIYSHRIGDNWLAGGASNSGGKVLAQFFSARELADLSARIDPVSRTGLSYYPLPGTGERFPIVDPDMVPRMEPRPDDDVMFLQALLEGMTVIERTGYDRLAELGAPKLASMRTVGGGSANPAWTAMRQRALGVPFLDAATVEAAAGTARLALKGARAAGLLP